MENHIKQVAEVTLKPGIIAWYDKLTKIYLTEQNPSEKVFNYMNTSNIRNAIKHKVILLSKGSLDFRRVPENVEELEARYEVKQDVAEASLEKCEPIQEAVVNEVIDESPVSNEENAFIKEETPVEENINQKKDRKKKSIKKDNDTSKAE